MDCRHIAQLTSKWYKSVKGNKVVVEIIKDTEFDDVKEELTTAALDLLDDEGCITFSAKFEVCSVCQGSGTHVNPNIDSNGITSDEWERDWSYEDRQAYIGGTYNVTCYNCNGMRVTPSIDERYLSAEQRELVSFIQKRRREEEDYAIECRREIEMGC